MRLSLLLYRSAKQTVWDRRIARFGREPYQAPTLPEFVTSQAIDGPTASRSLLERILTENIIAFWSPTALDRQAGGFLLNRDNRNNPDSRTSKHIVMQSRMTWFFARLARAGYAPEQNLQVARHGFEFMQRHMWDEAYGGFFREVDRFGRVATTSKAIALQGTERYKHLYGQSMALFALSEYALVSHDTRATARARDLFDLLEAQAHDAEYVGYREYFAPDWSPPPKSKLPHIGVARSSQKTVNTHLHLMEAMTTYYQLTQDPIALIRLRELIQIQSEHVVHKEYGVGVDRHERDWSAVRDRENLRASFGHDLENIQLLMEACTAAGLNEDAHLSYYRHLFDYALTYGWDEAKGGFYLSGPLGTPADRREKVWWVQAECLLAALKLYLHTKEESYARYYACILDWIARHQIDWNHGEWHRLVLENGRPFGEKVHPENKGAYHNGRAMIECLDLTKP